MQFQNIYATAQLHLILCYIWVHATGELHPPSHRMHLASQHHSCQSVTIWTCSTGSLYPIIPRASASGQYSSLDILLWILLAKRVRGCCVSCPMLGSCCTQNLMNARITHLTSWRAVFLCSSCCAVCSLRMGFVTYLLCC